MCAVDDSARWAHTLRGLYGRGAGEGQCEVLSILYPPYRDDASGLKCAVMCMFPVQLGHNATGTPRKRRYDYLHRDIMYGSSC